jgi:hypothetical protein
MYANADPGVAGDSGAATASLNDDGTVDRLYATTAGTVRLCISDEIAGGGDNSWGECREVEIVKDSSGQPV